MSSSAEAVSPEPDAADGEPSFGDLITFSSRPPVDVEASFDDSQDRPTSPRGTQASRAMQLPSATSLGTVLSQALRTNDVQLLESCLQVREVPAVQSTIQRLDSALAATLLFRLAERIHRRPGRTGSLMVWVQWTLVAHGGYLAGQPAMMRKLSVLHRVLREHAEGLQPLLALKGKLDMLEAQMQLRKGLSSLAAPGAHDEADEVEDVNDDRVIYVEGDKESETDDDRRPARNGPVAALAGFSDANDDDEEEEDDDDEMPTTYNGAIADSDVASDEDMLEEDDLLDDEAEETDADTGEEADDDDVDDEDEEEDDDGDDYGIEDNPPKAPRLGDERPQTGKSQSSKRLTMTEPSLGRSSKRRRQR